MRKNIGIYKILFVAITLIVVVVGILFFKSYPKQDALIEHHKPETTTEALEPITDPPVKPVVPMPEGISMQGFSIITNQRGLRVVKGLITNNSKKNIPLIEIRFKQLDQDGNAAGTTSTFINDLPAGFEWQFEASIAQRNIASVELDSVNIRR